LDALDRRKMGKKYLLGNLKGERDFVRPRYDVKVNRK
jgi:hypothetical protein